MKGQSNVAYVPPGYLVFHRNGTLMSQPFDAKRLSLSAEPVRIADGLAFSQQFGLADFAVSNSGVLLYRTGAVGAQSRQLATLQSMQRSLCYADLSNTS